MWNYPFTLHVRLNAGCKIGCQHHCLKSPRKKTTKHSHVNCKSNPHVEEAGCWFPFFTKMSKISKIVLSCFCDSVTGWSSRMSQSRAHTEIFRCSLAGQCPSHEKYLEYFSKFGFLMFLATQSGNLFVSGRSSRERDQRFSQLTSRLSHG